MEQKTTHIVLVPVVYNNPGECRQYIESILRANLSGIRLTIIVADNSAADNTSHFNFPVPEQVTLIYFHTKENLGYMPAGNAAYEQFVKGKMQHDLFIISNTDLLIEDKDFFQIMGAKDKTCDHNVFLFAPYISSSLTGRNLNPQLIRKPGKAYVERIRFLYSNQFAYNSLVLLSWMKHKYVTAENSGTDDMPIYAPHGSIFIFRNAFFKAGGNVAFPYFLFGEEIYIAEQVQKLKGLVIYTPVLRLVHNEHTSTGLFKWGRKFNAIRQVRANMNALYGY
ncbi:glycosyltransferase family 2 protein [Chitinophagaceae bacterium MMS25-I14]